MKKEKKEDNIKFRKFLCHDHDKNDISISEDLNDQKRCKKTVVGQWNKVPNDSGKSLAERLQKKIEK